MTRPLAACAALFALSPARAADNTPPEGFVALFNGKDLSGWKQQQGAKGGFAEKPTAWTVDNGAIKYVKDSGGGNAHLRTEKEYRNYELHADWKFHGRGTTGLFLVPAHVKIWDATKTDGWAATGSGSLGYGDAMVRPLKKADKPLGEWNHFRIVVQAPAPPKAAKGNPRVQGTITIWLNGELVIDRQPRNVAPGTIGLQDHGTEVWFKNVYLKELPDAPAAAAEKPAPQLHVFESDRAGFNTKTVFYDTGEEVVAFDTQFTPELAQKAIDFLRTKTKSPLTHVVVTHPNIDKFNGVAAFQAAGAKAVASAKTAAALPAVYAYKKDFFTKAPGAVKAYGFTDATFPKLGKVDVTFEKTHELKLKGGGTVELRELSKPGISTNQTVAYIPALKAVVVGDLVHHKAHAWIEGGVVGGKAVPTLKSWVDDLAELNELYGKDPKVTVYGGRGEAAPLPAAVEEQTKYLRKAHAIVGDFLAGLGDDRAKLKDPHHVDEAFYKKLQAEFEKAFPDYQLSYLTRSGLRAAWDAPGAEKP